MSQGSVRWWVIGLYLRSVGYVMTLAIVMSLILMQLSQNFTFLWLAYWVKNRARNATTVELADDIHETTSALDHGFIAVDNIVHSIVNRTLSFIDKLDGKTVMEITTPSPVVTQAISIDAFPTSDSFYLEMYFGLAGVNLLFTIMRAFLFAYGGVQAATRLHKSLLKVVVKVSDHCSRNITSFKSKLPRHSQFIQYLEKPLKKMHRC